MKTSYKMVKYWKDCPWNSEGDKGVYYQRVIQHCTGDLGSKISQGKKT